MTSRTGRPCTGSARFYLALRTGTITSAAWTNQGKYGSALVFNGTSSRISINDSLALHLTTGMTLEAWVNPAASNGFQSVIMKERTGGLSYALYATDNTGKPPATYINTGGSDQRAAGASVLPLNTWSHLAVTLNGTTLTLFVNGVQAGTKAVTGSFWVRTSQGDTPNHIWQLDGIVDLLPHR